MYGYEADGDLFLRVKTYKKEEWLYERSIEITDSWLERKYGLFVQSTEQKFK
jgi:hypothetical protein